MIRNRPVSLGLAVLFLWSNGCTKWVAVEQPWGPTLEQQEKLRITNELGVQTVLREPHVRADSVWGISVTSYWERGDLSYRESPVAIPMEGIRKVEQRGPDVLTPLVVIGVMGLIAGLIGAAAMSEGFDFSGAFGN